MIIQYNVLNGEISISFSSAPDSETLSLIKANGFKWNWAKKLWEAPYSNEREKIAKKIVGNDPNVAIKQEESKLPHISLDEALSNSLKGGNTGNSIEQIVFEQMASNPDSIIDLINRYKDESKSIESEKSQYEEYKLALKEIASRKKFVTSKKSILEKIITTYLINNNLDKQKCTDYSLILSTVKSFSLSKEYVEALIARLELPAWLNVEISLKKEVLEQMETIPEGVEVIQNRKFTLQKNLSETSNESLDLFIRGLTIEEISRQRGFKWVTIFQHLVSAVAKGELDLLDYIDSETLDAIKEYHLDNPSASTIQEYVNAFSGHVNYDIMALALKYLKIK